MFLVVFGIYCHPVKLRSHRHKCESGTIRVLVVYFSGGTVPVHIHTSADYELFLCRSCFYAQKQLCFQRVLGIAILSVCLSVCHTGGSGKNGPS